MLKCKDFHASKQTGTFSLTRKYEPIERVLERVNAWISSKEIRVLNVETVCSYCVYTSQYYDVRVWYEE